MLNKDLQARLAQFVDKRPIGSPADFKDAAVVAGLDRAAVADWLDAIALAAVEIGVIDAGQGPRVLLTRLDTKLSPDNAQRTLKAIFRVHDDKPGNGDDERKAKIQALKAEIALIDSQLDAARALRDTLPQGDLARVVLKRGIDVTVGGKAAFARKRDELQEEAPEPEPR